MFERGMGMSSESRSEIRRQQTVSIGNWVGTLVLMAIPVVNLVMAIIWAVSTKVPSKRNFAIAWILLTVICLIVSVVMIALFGQTIVDFLLSLDFAAWEAVLAG